MYRNVTVQSPLNKIQNISIYNEHFEPESAVEEKGSNIYLIYLNSIFLFCIVVFSTLYFINLIGYVPSENIFNSIKKGENFLSIPNAETKDKFVYIEYSEKERKELFDLVNEYRNKNGLSSLTYDKKLEESAKEHAEDMFNRHYFSHTDPEGKTPIERAPSLYASVGENIVQADLSAELPPSEALEKWIESPSHNEVLLHKNWNKTGVYCKQGIRLNGITGEEEQIAIWVQLYAN